MTDNPMYDYPASAFPADARVATHPACDLHARGVRWGNVVMAGRVRITVRFDGLPNPVSVPRTYLRPVDE